MDDRLRRLERAALSGEPRAITEYAGGLLRAGEFLEVRKLLHPRVKRYPEDRFLFLEAMPEDTAAFCGLCGNRLDLNDEGFPLSDKKRPNGTLRKKRRMTKKKKHCDECQGQIKTANFHGQPIEDRYCLFCGIAVRDNSHRCVGTRPGWVSGETSQDDLVGASPQRQAPHWTNWRRY